MHFQKNILCLISSLLLAVPGMAFSGKIEKADSIYGQMTDAQRIRQLIWISSPPQRSLPVDEQFGGVYYEAPLSTGVDHPGHVVAVQLDDRLNPVTEDLPDLPDMYTLAALSESDLLSTYFHFLKSASKERGIDCLVLPEVTARQNERVNLLLQQLRAHDPDFYLSKTSLSFSDSQKKKDLIDTYASGQYWVMSADEGELLSKKLDKHSARIIAAVDMEQRIKESILVQLEAGPTGINHFRLPNQLAVAISKASVIPLQRQPGILPLERDTICFLTTDPYGKTAGMMRKYAYVVTEYDDIVYSSAPIVIDNGVSVPDQMLSSERKVIFIGNPRSSQTDVRYIDGALLYSQGSEAYTYVIPQQLFGATPATGKMSFGHVEWAAFGNQEIAGKRTLGYAPAEMTGLDAEALARIEEIMKEAIHSRSTPGGQLAIAVDGAIVLNEAYGFLTYDSLIPVDRSTLYDLASVTKVMATLLAVMKLYEEGQIDLDRPLADYLPNYQGSNKRNITIRALLAHNAGLRSYVPFWQNALSADFMDSFYYASAEDEQADKRSYGLQPTPVFIDSLKNWILQSPLVDYGSEPGYLYSDIGFMILHQVVEQVSGVPLDEYVSQHFYEPMGLQRVTFNPLRKGYQLFEIAPTEYDYHFRDELVWGEVHDRNAAVFGGVSGHAGLFANANELLVIFQTILQGGTYDGKEFLRPSTLEYFNQRFFPGNGRALGWDKMDVQRGNASHMVSDESFGHTGFTGTMVWADPGYNLIFIFLSNRIHPNSNNYQLIRKNIRTRIQDVVYEALLTKWMK